MKKSMSFLLLLAFLIGPLKAADIENVKPVKNIILLIPDGTSLSTVSIARWLQWYNNPDMPNLAIDPYMCGTVRTFSSNAPIGDSAPTTSCYMTGIPSIAGYVSTHPVQDAANDILPIDSTRAYQPLVTVLEAAKMKYGKSTGLVFTCEFPHATPADCSAHSYNRGKYEWIAPQMAHNDLTVVIGGGTSLLPAESESYLRNNGYSVFKDNLKGMREFKGEKMWSLFSEKEMPYDLDRDTAAIPSLEEMTRTAISKLSQNEKGFFLMVEGSKIDWAAHANDPMGMASDYLAFDRACGAALEFAKANGETAVIIVPDHGNSGISLGSSRCSNYSKLTKDQLFGQFAQYKLTSEGFQAMLNSRPASEVQNIFRTYAGFELNDDELKMLYNNKGYKNSPIPLEERTKGPELESLYSGSLSGFIAKLLTSKTCFGFTTGGHTGEEVFLAAYHPEGDVPMGVLTNVDLNHYMCALFEIKGELDEMSNQTFAKHTDVFKGYKYEIVPSTEKNGTPTLVVKSKKKQLTIKPFTNLIQTGKKGTETIKLNSVVVYVDKNNTFYLPSDLAKHL